MNNDVKFCGYQITLVYTNHHKVLINNPQHYLNIVYSQRLDTANRSKLFQGHQSLQRTTESIARSHQIAAETDQIGTDIIDELGEQRETLVRTRGKVGESGALNFAF